MPRKGENIRKRKDGRWEARYIRERGADGSAKYGYIYGKSYTEAKTKRSKMITELAIKGKQEKEKTAYPFRSDIQMGKLFDIWQKNIRYTIKSSTYTNYDSILRNHLRPLFRTCLFSELTNQQIQQFVEREQEMGTAAGTICFCLSVLHTIISFAQNMRFYPKEPLCFKYPRQENTQKKVMKESDYAILKQYLMNCKTDDEFGILLCLCTGIRVGELSGLRWSDINFERKTIQIQRTVTRIKNLEQTEDNGIHFPKTLLHIGPPKTANSNREIPLPDKIIQIARQFQKSEEVYIMSGNPQCMEPRMIQRKFQKILNICQIPPIKFHSLRHQFSCEWIKNGLDMKALSEILGHASVHTTLNIYVHINIEQKQIYMNQLMNLF